MNKLLLFCTLAIVNSLCASSVELHEAYAKVKKRKKDFDACSAASRAALAHADLLLENLKKQNVDNHEIESLSQGLLTIKAKTIKPIENKALTAMIDQAGDIVFKETCSAIAASNIAEKRKLQNYSTLHEL